MKSAVHNQWLDPSNFDSKEEFFKAYTESHGRAKAYSEIINKLVAAEKRVEDIAKAIKGEKSYEI